MSSVFLSDKPVFPFLSRPFFRTGTKKIKKKKKKKKEMVELFHFQNGDNHSTLKNCIMGKLHFFSIYVRI